jgi:hypothetical protein
MEDLKPIMDYPENKNTLESLATIQKSPIKDPCSSTQDLGIHTHRKKEINGCDAEKVVTAKDDPSVIKAVTGFALDFWPNFTINFSESLDPVVS